MSIGPYSAPFALALSSALAVACSARDVVYVGAMLGVQDAASDALADAGDTPELDAQIEVDADVQIDADASTPTVPPELWREHWRGHSEQLSLIAYNDQIALYFDADVDRSAYGWAFSFLSDMWRHTLASYGSMGVERLYIVIHGRKHAGAHHGLYYEASHDFRNTLDIGGINPTNENTRTLFVSHEASHIVEFASFGMQGSPAFRLWRDSKWAEFFQYDSYVALGMTEQAERGYDNWTQTADAFPRSGTHWFRDWFYPIWRDHGRARVMRDYFELLSKYFPAENGRYSRELNWGEYVHFMSGAAKTDLKTLATQAFGWPQAWEAEFLAARSEFSQIAY